MDICARSGGGRVVLRSGRSYRSASLELRSHVELHLENGSVLTASGSLDDYIRPEQPGGGEDASQVGTPVTGKPAYVFLYAKGCDDIRITGGGVVDGHGDAFVRRVSDWYVTGDFYPRPTLIYLEDCRFCTFRDVTLRNVSFWTLHLGGCYDTLIDGIRILNPLDVANSDGIDVDHSRFVRIANCHIECADDCICMKNTLGNREYPHTRDVIVTGCTLISTSAALKIGTEGVDDFENISFSHCIIDSSNRGLSIQVRDKGNVRNISFSDIIIGTRRFADSWWGCAEPIAITAVDRDADIPGGCVEHVRFFNIDCLGENGAILCGRKGRVRDIVMDSVSISLNETSRWPKNRYDLRPGVGMSLIKRRSVPLLSCGVEDLVLRNVSLRDFTGETAEPELHDTMNVLEE